MRTEGVVFVFWFTFGEINKADLKDILNIDLLELKVWPEVLRL